MSKKLTIKDVAEMANVSVATVSRVINNNGRFSEETREKVLKIIDETGYEINSIAKSLRENKTYTIGIIVPDISNYFFYSVVQKIEQIIFNLGYATIICNTDRNNKKEQSYLKVLQSKGVDGIIAISGDSNFVFNNPDIPYICIDREPSNKSNTIFIGSDHFKGAYLATNELIKRGSKYPAIIYHSNDSAYSKKRIEGFYAAINDSNIIVEQITEFKLDQNSTDGGIRNLLKLKNIDSIFAINDNVAINILQILNNENICIPDEIQLIGFDDNSINSYLFPTLSSVKQDIDLIAKYAVKYLISLIEDTNPPGLSVIVPVDLVMRQSTKKLK